LCFKAGNRLLVALTAGLKAGIEAAVGGGKWSKENGGVFFIFILKKSP